jgi:hypothetical protein
MTLFRGQDKFGKNDDLLGEANMILNWTMHSNQPVYYYLEKFLNNTVNINPLKVLLEMIFIEIKLHITTNVL